MQWTWTWANSRRWRGTERPGMLQSIGSQRVGHDWATEQYHVYINVLICMKYTPKYSVVMGHQISSLISNGSGKRRSLFCICNSYLCLKFSQNKIFYTAKNKKSWGSVAKLHWLTLQLCEFVKTCNLSELLFLRLWKDCDNSNFLKGLFKSLNEKGFHKVSGS